MIAAPDVLETDQFTLPPAPTPTPTVPPAAKVDMPAASQQQSAGVAFSLLEISRLANAVNGRVSTALREIDQINLQTRLLSFNAQLEASHAGFAGRAFDVVAKEMVELSARTGQVARTLEADAQSYITDLSRRIDRVATDVRGTRLSDLAYTNIDLIDRNLYERSCDVRWWATDASCVNALLEPGRHAVEASRRLGVILDAYTVYFDIVLCDLDGRIIANGRSGRFRCLGSDQSNTQWFRDALETASGAEFGFAGLHQSPTLANGANILVYSAAVRRGGRVDGAPIGCLGVIFNWDALGQTIALRTQLGADEKRHTRVCITDQTGAVIADSHERHLRDRIALEPLRQLIDSRKSYMVAEHGGTPSIIGYAHSPGFETYATGWHSFIFQNVAIS